MRFKQLLGDLRVSFVDVGARDGIPIHWSPFASILNVIAVEAEAGEAAALNAPPTALSSADGSGVLHITQSPGCASLLYPNQIFVEQFPDSKRFNIKEEVSVSLSTLDSIVSGQKVDFIKIDVQGAAYEVLSGSDNSLNNAIGVEVECEFAPMYINEHLFPDIHNLMLSKNFELVDLRPAYWRRKQAEDASGCKGQIVFADALYMRPPSYFSDSHVKKNDLLKAFAICEVYGLFDYIITYADAANIHDLQIDNWVRRAKSRPILARLGAFRPMRGMALFLQDVCDLVLTNRWAYTQQSIANTPRKRAFKGIRRAF